MSADAAQESQRRELLRRALLELRDAKAAVNVVRSGPVAVVGVGCRLPGGVCSFEGFWEFLRAGGDGVVEVPGDRWDVDALFDPDPDAPGRTYARHGGFIGGVDGFDDRFFGISPREAVAMDPQQRLVLEVGWEALEHAGIAPDGLRDSETGVFVGLGANDYLLRGSRSLDPADLDAYVGTGNASSVVSGRLSYVLGLRGPSMVVDTACSSSLVAVHLACQSLRGGECDLALAGGVNLMLASDTTIVLSKARMLSASGRCRTFDAAADGYVRGEGCGILVLRRLQDAIAAHDTVLAVIRGSAVNQDGHSSGLTVPYAAAQEGVVARALAMAGVTGSEVGYVEAHGTGTALGDPIEVGALARVLAGEREHPLLVGSVKTNIGHLEAAAGVAGLIKAVLVVAHGEVPPHLHLREPNPRIPWQELSLRVPTQITPLPAGRRIAGVSSFGFSGTNAHVIVEGPPLSPASPDITPSTHDVPSAHDAPSTHDRVIVKLAAHGQPALTASAQRLACWVEQHTEVQLNALAWTANVARAELPDRAAVIAASQGELLQGLRSIATGTPKRGVVRGQTPVRTPPKSAFLVPGQGSHAAGAAAELYHTQPVFRHTLDRLAEILGPHQQLPLLALFDPGADSQRALAMTEHAQPALYALAVALGEWWRAAGVTPDALVGHSVGAYAAAALAGVLSLEDGAQLVCVRGRLMSTLPAGAMAAVFTNEDTARTILADTQPDKQAITLAAVNTPTEIVLAGEPHQLQHVLAQFTAQGIASKQLTVAHAFHTHHVEPILDQLEQELTRTTLNPPTTPLISDTTGKLAEEQATTPAYWIHHTRHPTNFNNALQTLKQLGCHQLIELGPTTTLLGMAQATLQPTPTLLPSLRPHHPPTQQLLQSTATAWTNGTPLHWQNLNNPPNTPPHLPTYPFQHRTHWPHTKHTHDIRALTPTPVLTPLPHRITELELSTRHQRYLTEHTVHGHTVVPGVTYLELLLAGAGLHLDRDETPVVRRLVLHQPLILATDGPRTLQAVLDPPMDGLQTGRLYSRAESESGWDLHATATLAAGGQDLCANPVALSQIRSRLTRELSGEDFYRYVWHPQFELGRSFRLIERVWIGKREALGLVRVADTTAPAARAGIRSELLTLDACTQLLVGAQYDATAGATPNRPVALGAGFDHFLASGPLVGQAVWCWARLDGDGRLDSRGDLLVFDTGESPLAEIRGVAFRRVASETLRRVAKHAHPDPDYGAATAAAKAALETPAPSRKTLLSVARGERQAILLAYLQQRLGTILELSPAELDPEMPMIDLVDSLMLAELKVHVERDLAITVALESFFEDPTLAGFSSQLSAQLEAGRQGQTPDGMSTLTPADSLHASAAMRSDVQAAPDTPDQRIRMRPRSTMTVAELSAAVVLEPTISARSALDPNRARSPHAVLLTGATEHVGTLVLAELLRRTRAEVICLVHDDDVGHATSQIDAALLRYRRPPDTRGRVSVIPGRLDQPLLGLNASAFANLASHIDGIYHLATAAQWAYPFSALYPINVGATHEILRLAAVGVPTPVHFYSTVGVFSSPEYASNVVSETVALERSGALSMGYAQTKWVAERLVRTASERGLPVTIFRAAIGADGRTGQFDPNHHISLMLKGCIELQAAPDWDLPIQLAPADYIAAASVDLSLRPDHYGETFHLVNPSVLTWAELADRLRGWGYRLARRSGEEWRAMLNARNARQDGNALAGLLPLLLESIEHARLPRFDCSRTLRALQGTPIDCPPLDASLLRVYLSRLIAAGFIPPPPEQRFARLLSGEPASDGLDATTGHR